eukprot:gene16481-biopygen11468
MTVPRGDLLSVGILCLPPPPQYACCLQPCLGLQHVAANCRLQVAAWARRFCNRIPVPPPPRAVSRFASRLKEHRLTLLQAAAAFDGGAVGEIVLPV